MSISVVYIWSGEQGHFSAWTRTNHSESASECVMFILTVTLHVVLSSGVTSNSRTPRASPNAPFPSPDNPNHPLYDNLSRP